MQPKSHLFKEESTKAIGDANLQSALKNLQTGFVAARARAADGLDEFEALRDEAVTLKDHILANLDFYLERFEEKVTEAGGTVHFCATAEEARQTILELCRRYGAKSVTKGKSMVAEEVALNPFLEANGIEPVETDLGEYIIQLAKEAPSHIIGPAVHKTKEQVSDLFHEHHAKYGRTERLTEAEDLVTEAREVLRQKYFDADVGITGANFLIAETGSTIIVTNEGNGDLTQMLPKAHVVISAIDKVVPTLEDVSTILRVLARSATGQEMSAYTTLSTGPKREGDLDGPEGFHVVLLDNGRSDLLGTDKQDLLRCIRCGACMNHCPVYTAVGGHAYGWVYPGPIGAALDPHIVGLEEARHLPNASTFCGRCEQVCPMRIPLPKIMRHWREEAFERGLPPARERLALKGWAWMARHPWAYRLAARIGIGVMGRLGRRRGGRFRDLPLARAWTKSRDMPAPEGRTFIDRWKAGERG
ncbi:LutB/LldF family L-lactate oxidation iron-sulfur protein [Minwuia thermotolerans]|uniref:Iron-sulfur cluster-binding protein n=1 Tax=Minwuia thermotolerans TaxID=2056226 RepID=A0A2M9FYR6_9PROT|nr:LutB/LldF family L-lactate oxidation iron-sulfur protein [Minwuia thermotolerans]PJK28605.1 iron-sulfur cluster-binding protein [Minwuia thermotolerans]